MFFCLAFITLVNNPFIICPCKYSFMHQCIRFYNLCDMKSDFIKRPLQKSYGNIMALVKYLYISQINSKKAMLSTVCNSVIIFRKKNIYLCLQILHPSDVPLVRTKTFHIRRIQGRKRTSKLSMYPSPKDQRSFFTFHEFLSAYFPL